MVAVCLSHLAAALQPFPFLAMYQIDLNPIPQIWLPGVAFNLSILGSLCFVSPDMILTLTCRLTPWLDLSPTCHHNFSGHTHNSGLVLPLYFSQLCSFSGCRGMGLSLQRAQTCWLCGHLTSGPVPWLHLNCKTC